MVEPIYRQVPTGGVVSPMVKFNTIMTPRCIGLIPTNLAIGIKIGVKRIRPALGSKIVPIIKSIRLINMRIKYLLLVSDKSHSPSNCGMRTSAIIQPMTLVNDMIISIEALTTTLFTTISKRSFNLNPLKIKQPTTKAYTTATADASVGVKTPDKIPDHLLPILEEKPQEFDSFIFNEIQNYLIIFDESFSKVRPLVHLKYLLSYLYLFRKIIIHTILIKPLKPLQFK